MGGRNSATAPLETPDKAGTDYRRRCFTERDFRVGLDQPLAAGHLRRQHLIRRASDDVLNAAQKPGDEQDFYR